MGRKALAAAFLLLLTSIWIVQPALAQGPVWNAQYFNNAQLSGNPVFTRQDGAIAFNWGTGSPGNGINADNFSVRWGTDVALSPGTYRFYAQADDNIRIFFNFVNYAPVIDTFTSGAVGQLVTGDVNVTQAGTYHIQVDYRELTDQAYAFVSYANVASNPTGPNFTAPTTPLPVATSSWTAQYYANTNLSGNPTAIVSENDPSHNWGTGAPFPSLPADNFSARWTSTQTLTGGNYNIAVSADDGVRVWVNGNLLIDQWHGASGQTYNAGITLPAGPAFFQIEYYEATANAFLNFAITQTSGGTIAQPTPQPPVPTGASATVTAYRLNVRATPDPINGQIITRVSRLEVYPVVGRNADNSWFLITVNGVNGWVSGGFINVVNGASVPVVNGNGQQQPTPIPAQAATGNSVTATPFNVVIRSGPGTQYSRIGLFPNTGVAPVVGRNSNNTWWQINLNGLVGWVSAQFAIISPSANIGSIPVTG